MSVDEKVGKKLEILNKKNDKYYKYLKGNLIILEK